jgi:hypothetical protein
MIPIHKVYLGDGVYVDLDSGTGDIVLTTSDGIRDTNRIVLEAETLHAFDLWRAELRDPS